jgi:hypothetical protein
MITVARVIGEVRRLLKDQDPDNPRHDDADLRGAMALALFEMRRLRPDAFLSVGLATVSDLADQSVTQFDVESIFLMPMVMMTVGFLQIENDEYAEDGVAGGLLSLARNALVGL